MACGQAGMREVDFWACEIREVWNRINGFWATQKASQKADAELMRLQTTTILRWVSGKKLKVTDVMAFPWDKGDEKKEIRIMTPEERHDPKADAYMKAKWEAEQKRRDG